MRKAVLGLRTSCVVFSLIYFAAPSPVQANAFVAGDGTPVVGAPAVSDGFSRLSMYGSSHRLGDARPPVAARFGAYHEERSERPRILRQIRTGTAWRSFGDEIPEHVFIAQAGRDKIRFARSHTLECTPVEVEVEEFPNRIEYRAVRIQSEDEICVDVFRFAVPSTVTVHRLEAPIGNRPLLEARPETDLERVSLFCDRAGLRLRRMEWMQRVASGQRRAHPRTVRAVVRSVRRDPHVRRQSRGMDVPAGMRNFYQPLTLVARNEIHLARQLAGLRGSGTSVNLAAMNRRLLRHAGVRPAVCRSFR